MIRAKSRGWRSVSHANPLGQAGPGGLQSLEVRQFSLHILPCMTGHLPAMLPDFPASRCLLPQGDIHGLASLTEVHLPRGPAFPPSPCFSAGQGHWAESYKVSGTSPSSFLRTHQSANFTGKATAEARHGSRLHSWQEAAHMAFSGIDLCFDGLLLCTGLCGHLASLKTVIS